MSRDIQFVSIVDDLVVVDVSDVAGADPRTIRIQGRSGFRSAVRVDINGYKVDAITITSDKVILAVLPDSLKDIPTTEMGVLVYSSRWSGQQRVRLVFGLTMNSRTVSGVEKLVQQVVKGLLTTSGSNRFAREEGGGLLSSLGTTISPNARGQVAAAVAQAVNITEANMISAQAGESSLGMNEKLLKLQLLGLDFIEAEMEVRAVVRLQTMAGATINIPLTL